MPGQEIDLVMEGAKDLDTGRMDMLTEEGKGWLREEWDRESGRWIRWAVSAGGWGRGR